MPGSLARRCFFCFATNRATIGERRRFLPTKPEIPAFREFFESGRVLRVHLKRLPGNIDNLGIQAIRSIGIDEADIPGHLAHIRAKAAEQPEMARVDWLDLLETILVYKTAAYDARRGKSDVG